MAAIRAVSEAFKKENEINDEKRMTAVGFGAKVQPYKKVHLFMVKDVDFKLIRFF